MNKYINASLKFEYIPQYISKISYLVNDPELQNYAVWLSLLNKSFKNGDLNFEIPRSKSLSGETEFITLDEEHFEFIEDEE